MKCGLHRLRHRNSKKAAWLHISPANWSRLFRECGPAYRRDKNFLPPGLASDYAGRPECGEDPYCAVRPPTIRYRRATRPRILHLAGTKEGLGPLVPPPLLQEG